MFNWFRFFVCELKILERWIDFRNILLGGLKSKNIEYIIKNVTLTNLEENKSRNHKEKGERER
jgi:hypothetical protein